MKQDLRPASLYVNHPTMETQVVLVKKGLSGFYPVKRCSDREEADRLRVTLNQINDLPDTPAMREAMLAGSMFGWDVPGAFPEAYVKGA